MAADMDHFRRETSIQKMLKRRLGLRTGEVATFLEPAVDFHFESASSHADRELFCRHRFEIGGSDLEEICSARDVQDQEGFFRLGFVRGFPHRPFF